MMTEDSAKTMLPDATHPDIDAAILADEFIRFSRIVHGDSSSVSNYEPYPWQIRLAQQVAATGRWPGRIVAPTGSGKTCVVDVHLFVQALAGLNRAAVAPRRLALIVNRRALVDSQFEYAQRLVVRLEESAAVGNAAAKEYLDGLRRRGQASSSAPVDVKDTPRPAVQVVNLRGGQAVKDPATASWRQWPDLVSILCFTPEMFGSRLLFRGYGVGRGARPIEAGLLARDTVAIIDEAHLSRQLTLTAQQVPRIEALAEIKLPLVPLQTVISTATPQDADKAGGADGGCESRSEQTLAMDDAVEVIESDLFNNEHLRERLRSPKPLRLVNLPSGLQKKNGMNQFVQEVIALRSETSGTVGVVVNTVAAAMEVTRRLRSEKPDGDVVQIVGRLRPYDRAKIQHDHKGLFSSVGDSRVAFVVGTQTLEVGLDIGFSGMVTELAPGDALAQRAGRVNRFAKYPQGPIVVAVQPEESRNQTSKKGRFGGSIYTSEDLQDAVEWLKEIQAKEPEEGLSPWVTARIHPPHSTALQRLILQRLEWWDVETLAASAEDPAAEQQIAKAGPATLDVWLRDDLDEYRTAGVAVRDHLPQSDGLAARLLEIIPPLQEEVAQIPVGQLYEFAKGLDNKAVGESISDDENSDEETMGSHARAFVIHPDQRPELVSSVSSFGEGDVVVLSAQTPAFDQGVFSPEGKERLEDGQSDVLDKVLESRVAEMRRLDLQRTEGAPLAAEDSIPTFWAVRVVVPAAHLNNSGAVIRPRAIGAEDLSREEVWELADALRQLQIAPLHDNLSETSSGTSLEEAPRQAFLTWLESHPWPAAELEEPITGSSLDDLRRLAAGDSRQCDVLTSIVMNEKSTVEYLGADDEDDEYMIVFTSNVVAPDDDFRQVSTSSRTGRVLLADHELSVGTRAYDIASAVGLEDITNQLEQAGLLHDQGKTDDRFQRLLRHTYRLLTEQEHQNPLAKSGFSSPAFERSFRHQVHLVGWRHEQRSAAEAWLQLANAEPSVRDLVARLVGTTHGHGLNSFPHGSKTLIPTDEPVSQELRTATAELFDCGEWESVVERTQRRFGLWGIAYLEAILRAADVQISAEGK